MKGSDFILTVQNYGKVILYLQSKITEKRFYPYSPKLRKSDSVLTLQDDSKGILSLHSKMTVKGFYRYALERQKACGWKGEEKLKGKAQEFAHS